jgi:hypothetical protein
MKNEKQHKQFIKQHEKLHKYFSDLRKREIEQDLKNNPPLPIKTILRPIENKELTYKKMGEVFKEIVRSNDKEKYKLNISLDVKPINFIENGKEKIKQYWGNMSYSDIKLYSKYIFNKMKMKNNNIRFILKVLK